VQEVRAGSKKLVMVLHLRPSFLFSERPPGAAGAGRDADCQADTPPGSGQQVFRRSASRRGDRAGLLLGQHPGDPDRRSASALLELITDHCRLILDRHRADGN
jgi:hypothetical protein